MGGLSRTSASRRGRGKEPVVYLPCRRVARAGRTNHGGGDLLSAELSSREVTGKSQVVMLAPFQPLATYRSKASSGSPRRTHGARIDRVLVGLARSNLMDMISEAALERFGMYLLHMFVAGKRERQYASWNEHAWPGSPRESRTLASDGDPRGVPVTIGRWMRIRISGTDAVQRQEVHAGLTRLWSHQVSPYHLEAASGRSLLWSLRYAQAASTQSR